MVRIISTLHLICNLFSAGSKNLENLSLTLIFRLDNIWLEQSFLNDLIFWGAGWNIYLGNLFSISIKFGKNNILKFVWRKIFLGGGDPEPIFFFTNLLVRVKLGYTPNFNFISHCLDTCPGEWLGGWESWFYNQLSSARLS